MACGSSDSTPPWSASSRPWQPRTTPPPGQRPRRRKTIKLNHPPERNPTMNPLDRLLAALAAEHLDIATLEARSGDSLDFHTVAVWQVGAALKAAFAAGAQPA